MSPAYSIFRVKNNKEILSDYLDMWFKRSEFDRECAFIAVGGVRGSMPWEEFAEIEVFVPDIDEQEKFVHKYQVISNRIALKQRINDNLAAIARNLFQGTFEKVFMDNSKLPSGWFTGTVGDFCEANISNISLDDNFQNIYYLDTGNIYQNYIDVVQYLNILTDEIPIRAKRKVFDGDIVFSTVRPNLKHYGIIYKPPINFIVSTGFAVLH